MKRKQYHHFLVMSCPYNHSLSQLSQKFFTSKSHLALVPAKSSSPPVHHLWTAIPPLATTSPHHLRHRTPRRGARPFGPPWHRSWWNLAGLPNNERREFGALAGATRGSLEVTMLGGMGGQSLGQHIWWFNLVAFKSHHPCDGGLWPGRRSMFLLW